MLKNRNIEKQTFKNTSAFLVLRRMFMPTRGNHIRLMSTILLRLLQPIKHRLRLVFLGNKLRESTLANRLRLFEISWRPFSSDCCPQSFFPSVERLNNKLRESCIPIEHRCHSLSWAGLQGSPLQEISRLAYWAWLQPDGTWLHGYP